MLDLVYAEFSEDVLHRSSCEWERPASIEAEFDDLNDMRNCASLVRRCPFLFAWRRYFPG